MATQYALIGLAVVIGAACVLWLLRMSAAWQERMASLERKIAELQEHVAGMEEELLPKRHTHRNAISIENVIATGLRARLDMSEAISMLETQLEILRAWRADPNYDSESKGTDLPRQE